MEERQPGARHGGERPWRIARRDGELGRERGGELGETRGVVRRPREHARHRRAIHRRGRGQRERRSLWRHGQSVLACRAMQICQQWPFQRSHDQQDSGEAAENINPSNTQDVIGLYTRASREQASTIS